MKGVISNIADTYVIVLSKACSAIVIFWLGRFRAEVQKEESLIRLYSVQ
jgi:hypothetical protein